MKFQDPGKSPGDGVFGSVDVHLANQKLSYATMDLDRQSLQSGIKPNKPYKGKRKKRNE